MFVVMSAWAACGGDAVGTLSVTVRLQTVSGESRTCADFAVEQLELTFYADSEDQVGYDIATVDCPTSAVGRAMFALVLTAQTYERVVLRFITASGDTARLCLPGGVQDAVLEKTGVEVSEGVLGAVDFVLVGDSLPCTN